jgi:heat shock protein HslJ
MKKLIVSSLVLTGIVFTLISSSCNTSKKATEIDMSESFKLHPSDYQSDFTAYDQDSTWKLSIRFGEEIIFTSKTEKISFRATAGEELVAQGANIVKLKSKNDSHAMEITIDVAKCNKTGFIVDMNVQNLASNESYTFNGCGTYNGSPQLYDIWVLTELNGKTLQPGMFRKQMPYMEINLRDKTISGFGGCNEFSSQLTFSYKKMEVGPIAATKMYCAEESKIEKEFFNILNTAPVSYHKKELHLILENSAGSLTFKKVD